MSAFFEPLGPLPPGQRTALLFVLLFGVLSLATIYLFLRSLRRGRSDLASPLETQEQHLRTKRDLRVLWIGSMLFWLAWISGTVGSTLLFGVLSFLALREFITLTHTRRGDHRSLLLAFFIILPLQYVLVAYRSVNLFTVFIPVYAFLALPVVSALAGDPQRYLERNAKIQWGIMACVYGLSHAPALLLIQVPGAPASGAFLVFFLVAVVTTAHIAQEAASRWLRRRPVARQISRSFSMRAWMLGVAAATVVGLLLHWITRFDALQAMGLAAVAAASGTLGELVMRALKRDAGVRFWGNQSSVTGAVGLLDRIAPLCFAAPVFYHAVRWALGAPL